MNDVAKTRAFLIFCTVGLVPIALGYGARPSVTLEALFASPSIRPTSPTSCER